MIADLKPYAEYKRSDLPWAPILPTGWSTERAKRLFTKMARPVRDTDEVVTCFRDGMVTLRKNRRLRGYTEATVEHGYQGIRVGDLVIHGMDAFAGAIGVSDSDGKGTPVYNVCQPRPGVNARYYAHAVRQMSQSQWILALAKGIRERSTDFRYETFANQRVPLPTPAEQAAIVRFLDWATSRLDRAIRAKRKVIALLGEQKQAIIQRAVTRGLNPHVPTKPSGVPWLGEIPAHWEVVPSKALFRHRRDKAREDDELLTASQSHGIVSRASFMETERRRVMQGIRGSDILKHVEPNDFVMTMRSFQGGLEWSRVRGALSSAYVALVPNAQVVHRYFAYALKSRFYISALRRTSDLVRDGQALRYANFGQVPLPLIPIPEQNAIADFLDAEAQRIRAIASRLESEVNLLREYRTRLIADVVTGRLDVRQVAALLLEENQSELVATEVDLSDSSESLIDEAED